MRRRLTVVLAIALACIVCSVHDALACSRTTPLSTPEMLRNADAIVRVLASEYATAPSNPNIGRWPPGVPDSRIRFNVLEVIRGHDIQKDIVLPGYLSDDDDFNDHSPPYSFVRRNGRSGTCFANTYRTGAQFLLVLKKTDDGDYTVNWYALGPVNEQLRSENDPWLLWVRKEAQ